MKNILMISMPAIATRILSQRVEDAAKNRRVDVKLTVRSEAEGMGNINEFDMLLLPPHLRYLLNRRKNIGAKDSLVIKVIDSKVFGELDGDAVLNIVANSLR